MGLSRRRLTREFKVAVIQRLEQGTMRDAQGKFLEQLMGGKIHLLIGRVQGQSRVGSWVENFRPSPLSS